MSNSHSLPNPNHSLSTSNHPSSKYQVILDRNSYSATTLSVMEILAAYMTDLYYNHLYIEAIKFKNNKVVASITEGYLHSINTFVNAIADIKSKDYNSTRYHELLRGIHGFFTAYTSFESITISECIDKIVKEFTPIDYYNSMTVEQKRSIIRTLLSSAIFKIGQLLSSREEPYLSMIIDKHKDKTNVYIIKDKIIDVFLLERFAILNKFLVSISGGEKVDKHVVDKLVSDNKKLIEEREKLIINRKELLLKIEELMAENQRIKDMSGAAIAKARELIQKNKGLTDEVNALKNQVNNLNESLSGWKNKYIEKTRGRSDYEMDDQAAGIRGGMEENSVGSRVMFEEETATGVRKSRVGSKEIPLSDDDEEKEKIEQPKSQIIDIGDAFGGKSPMDSLLDDISHLDTDDKPTVPHPEESKSVEAQEVNQPSEGGNELAEGESTLKIEVNDEGGLKTTSLSDGIRNEIPPSDEEQKPKKPSRKPRKPTKSQLKIG